MLELMPFSPTWVLVGLCVVLLYMYMVWPFATFQKMVIPGPKPIPLFGNYLSYAKGAYVFDQECYKKYNKLYGIFEGRRPLLVVGDLKLLKQITVKEINKFTNRFQSSLPGRGDILSKSIMSMKDAAWKRARRAITPTFSSGKLKMMMLHVERCADILVSILGENQKKGIAFNMTAISGAYTMDVISSVLYGVDTDSLNNPNHPLLTNAKALFTFTIFSPFLLTVLLLPGLAGVLERLFGATFVNKKSVDFFGETVDKVISMRSVRSDEKRPVDFLQLMLQAHNEELDTNSSGDMIKHGVSKSELKGNAVLLWIAGYESTMNTLALTAYNLALHPEAQDKVIEEIDDIIEERGMLDYEAVKELHFLEMCINETMRMFPFTQRNDRICKEDTTVNGLHIPAGVEIVIPVYCIHHDPDIWPEPDKFKPERFTKKEKEARDPYAFLPFGSGPRNCVGMRLAMLELKVALAKALEKFRFVTCDKTEARIRPKNTWTNQIEGGVWLMVEARTASVTV